MFVILKIQGRQHAATGRNENDSEATYFPRATIIHAITICDELTISARAYDEHMFFLIGIIHTFRTVSSVFAAYASIRLT